MISFVAIFNIATQAQSLNHIVVWKTTHDLPKQSKETMKSWKEFPVKVVNDTDCQRLARQHRCYGYSRLDIMNIMRADACRYMALYEYGGIYTDLDVTLKTPFVDNCNGLCVGREYPHKNTIANYFMKAPQFDSCLLRAIQKCCTNLKTIKMDFKANPHLVHHSCGPDAFTAAVSSCASRIWPHSYFARHVHHTIASNSWNDYPSWIQERMKRAGWRHVYEH